MSADAVSLASMPTTPTTGHRVSRAEPRTCALGALLLLTLPALVLGCLPATASYVRSDAGEYSLVSTAGSVEKAVVRLQRTAEQLCPAQVYRVSDPQIFEREYGVGPFGMCGYRVTVRAYLSCSALAPPAVEKPAAE